MEAKVFEKSLIRWDVSAFISSQLDTHIFHSHIRILAKFETKWRILNEYLRTETECHSLNIFWSKEKYKRKP